MGGEGWLKREVGGLFTFFPSKGGGGLLEMGAQKEDLPYGKK